MANNAILKTTICLTFNNTYLIDYFHQFFFICTAFLKSHKQEKH